MTTDNLTPEEIREGNALIAIFDGMQCDGNENMFHRRSAVYIVTTARGLDYHNDWQWMIPAWAKVFARLDKYLLVHPNDEGTKLYIGVFASAVHLDLKPTAFRTLVAAIKLLNEKTK